MNRQEFDSMMASHGIEMPGEVAYRVARLAAEWERTQCAELLNDNWFRTQAECAAAIRARGDK